MLCSFISVRVVCVRWAVQSDLGRGVCVQVWCVCVFVCVHVSIAGVYA